MRLAELYHQARHLGFTVAAVVLGEGDTVESFTVAPPTTSAELAHELLARADVVVQAEPEPAGAEPVRAEATTTTERRDLVEVLTLELDDFAHRVARTTTEEAARAALSNTRTRLLEHFNHHVDHERRDVNCDAVIRHDVHGIVGYVRSNRGFDLNGRPLRNDHDPHLTVIGCNGSAPGNWSHW